MTNITPRQLHFRIGIGFALNAALLIALPETSKVVTGDVSHDGVKFGTFGLLAACAVFPSVLLLRHGGPYQKVTAMVFLVLPGWMLVMVATWAIGYL